MGQELESSSTTCWVGGLIPSSTCLYVEVSRHLNPKIFPYSQWIRPTLCMAALPSSVCVNQKQHHHHVEGTELYFYCTTVDVSLISFTVFSSFIWSSDILMSYYHYNICLGLCFDSLLFLPENDNNYIKLIFKTPSVNYWHLVQKDNDTAGRMLTSCCSTFWQSSAN